MPRSFPNSLSQRSHPNRQIAKDKGELYYYTGKVCNNGHDTTRFVSNGHCKECIKQDKAKYRLTTDGRFHELLYLKNYMTKEKIRTYTLSKYNLTLVQYEQMLKDQNNLCKICQSQLQPGQKTHVDHCKITKKVRGLLCHWCNVGIGSLKHDPNILRRAALYCETA